MRRLSQLITQVRRATENTSYDDSTGISDEEFIQYANDAQERIQSLISTANEEIFQEEAIISLIQGQEEYDIPVDAFLTTRIQNIEFSSSGERNYSNLPQGTMKNRVSTNSNSNVPYFYIRKSNKILIQPTPSGGGSIRVVYQKKLPKLDKRRGTVLSSVLDNSANTITNLFLDTTSTIDVEPIKTEGYISVVDKDGNIKMKMIPVQDVNGTSGEITVYPGFVFENGETISSDDYVVLGKVATTNSELPDICERYLISYMAWKILKRDSSDDSSEQNSELKEIENDIVMSYSEADQDVHRITILNGDFWSADDDDWY